MAPGPRARAPRKTEAAGPLRVLAEILTDSEECRLKDPIKGYAVLHIAFCQFLEWPGHTICALLG